ncbi:hypothetical protein SCHPADRAFT_887608 [Schizopora paradoxa]|uniref:F-box domain-containing protein n=1 Tax=Schizopora paradoxa TaxID=27342 RepID=A0A0H2S4U5_9AGAM|nr:hypothetical protein SCHPADRAFT_887608 [Schizopora paradoxa]
MSSLDSEATRSVALLLDALELLKRSGFDNEDRWKIWCMDWLRTSRNPDASLDTKVLVAKSSLSRMKAIAKLLGSISASLESSINHVAKRSRKIIQTFGFNSLPDDIIARIFELYHEEYRNLVHEGDAKNWGRSFRAANVLTQVSKRFRLVALHIPALWDCVSGKTRHAEEMIPVLKARCQNPTIFLDYDFFEDANVMIGAELLRLVQPASQWRGLGISYGRIDESRKLFEDIHTVSNGRMDNLLDLRIANVREPSDGDEDDSSSTNLFINDAVILAEWALPKLKWLTLSNIIPTYMDCPNLQECRIELGTNKAKWDLGSLRKFFDCIPLLESLSFSLSNNIPDRDDADDQMLELFEPVRLIHLRSLELFVTGETEGEFLKEVLDLLDLSTVSSLKIALLYDVDNTKDLGECMNDWFFGIRRTNGGGKHVFPNVTDFHLSLRQEYRESMLLYSDMMLSVPQARNVVLNLPGFSDPSFVLVFKYFKELRSIRLDDCNSFRGWSLASDLERVDQQKLDQLERRTVYQLSIAFQWTILIRGVLVVVAHPILAQYRPNGCFRDSRRPGDIAPPSQNLRSSSENKVKLCIEKDHYTVPQAPSPSSHSVKRGIHVCVMM